VLTAQVLGPQLGLARALGAVVFAVVIGLAMALIFRRSEEGRQRKALLTPPDEPARPLWQNAALIATLVLILVAATWAPGGEADRIQTAIHGAKWWLTGGLAALLAVQLGAWHGASWRRLGVIAVMVAVLGPLVGRPEAPFLAGVLGLAWVTAGREGELGQWFDQSWQFTRQILPLLLGGVLVAGFLLGRPGAEGLVPADWVASAVGGNGLGANLFAAVVGAFMYFATLTEVPILQGLLGSGMGQGPALALLLAGPALSLPNMLVIASVIGWRKTTVFVVLVVVMATVTGLLYGALS
jgi:uncharacterized membrane protein YraQ (UPF0718 family)